MSEEIKCYCCKKKAVKKEKTLCTKCKIITIIIVSFVVLIIIGLCVPDDSDTSGNSDISAVKKEPALTNNFIVAHPEIAIKTRVKQICDKYTISLYKLTVDKKEDDENGGYVVGIGIKEDSSFTTHLTKVGIKGDMADIYQEIYMNYNSAYNIDSVVIGAYLPLTDKYGNTKDTLSYVPPLSADEANKINWDIAKNNFITVSQVWRVLFEHSIFS